MTKPQPRTPTVAETAIAIAEFRRLHTRCTCGAFRYEHLHYREPGYVLAHAGRCKRTGCKAFTHPPASNATTH